MRYTNPRLLLLYVDTIVFVDQHNKTTETGCTLASCLAFCEQWMISASRLTTMQLNKLNIIVSLQVALLSVRLQVGLQYCD